MELITKKENHYLTLSGRRELVCTIERLNIKGSACDQRINGLMDMICDNVKKYACAVKQKESKERREQDRKNRLSQTSHSYLFTVKGRVFEEKYLDVSFKAGYKDRTRTEHCVINLQDGRFENAESFGAKKKYGRFPISMSEDGVSVYSKKGKFQVAPKSTVQNSKGLL